MRRFLIRDEASRAAVESRFEALGWHLVPSENQTPEVIRYKSSWTDSKEQQVASYMENAPLGCSYVLATNAVFDTLSQAFDTEGMVLGRDDVLQASLATDSDALRTIGRLGLLAHGPFDAKVFSRLSAYLISPNSKWQRYALYSLSNTSWSEFGSVLEKAIDGHAFDEISTPAARALLASLQSLDWNVALYDE